MHTARLQSNTSGCQGRGLAGAAQYLHRPVQQQCFITCLHQARRCALYQIIRVQHLHSLHVQYADSLHVQYADESDLKRWIYRAAGKLQNPVCRSSSQVRQDIQARGGATCGPHSRRQVRSGHAGQRHTQVYAKKKSRAVRRACSSAAAGVKGSSVGPRACSPQCQMGVQAAAMRRYFGIASQAGVCRHPGRFPAGHVRS